MSCIMIATAYKIMLKNDYKLGLKYQNNNIETFERSCQCNTNTNLPMLFNPI